MATSQRQHPARPRLTAVPASGAPRPRRMTAREAEAAVLSLVRAMGEGDLIEGLGKLQMLQALDSMRYDWLAVLEANLPDDEGDAPSARTPGSDAQRPKA